MTINRFGRKLLKITGICLGILAMLLTAFHFWFIAHAKELLQDTVEKKSKGKLKLKVEKLSYNYFSRKMVIKQAVFMTTDTLTAPSSYRFAVKEIRVQLKALLPLVLKKKLLIDSLRLQSPDIRVTTLRLTKDTIRRQPKDVSIPYEMGKVYNSIQDALKVLQVNRFQINDGKFSLINKAQQGQLPLHINNIYFQIDNLQVDTARLTGQEKLLFSDNVVLRSHDQDIVFPDGRHRLSFSSFRINLRNKLVEFDSCTIAATRTDSAASSFRVFFDTLKLTNIDFDTLYRAEVIKADSVYCLNPNFTLEVDAGKKKGPKKPIPKLEKIVQQLTGNLLLGFVVVQNADFDIKTVKDGKPTSFAFSKNNFEMQGLQVDQESVKPVTVKSFTMAIRNYENFIKDSSYSVKFDSVRLRDDRIILSSFLFNKLDNGKILNSFSVPEFRLEGLSWDDLVFERKLKARSAAMIRPYINYTADPNKKQEKQTIFQSLGAVNEFMDLEQLEIEDGTIDLKLRKDLRVQLEHANLSVKSQSLLSSTQLSGIRNSLNGLDFRHGKILAGSTTIELNTIGYNGDNGRFSAGSVWLNDPVKNRNIFLEEVAVDKLIVNESNGSIQGEGISWNKADIKLYPADTRTSDTGHGPAVDLKKIEGHNTIFSGMIKNNTITSLLDYISLDELKKTEADKLILKGLYAAGKKLKINADNMQLSVSDYHFADNRFSSFQNLVLNLNTPNLSGSISTPSLSFVTNAQRLLDGDLSAEVFSPMGPVARLRFIREKDSIKKSTAVFPKIRIGKLKLGGADIEITSLKGQDSVSLRWNGIKNPYYDFINVYGLQTGGNTALADSIGFYLTHLSFIDTKGKTFNTGDGKLSSKLRNISIEQKGNEPVTWKALVGNVEAENFKFESIGRKKGKLTLNRAVVKELGISSASIQNMLQLSGDNTSFQLSGITGNYTDAASVVHWYNAGFDRSSKIFSLDSFSFRPVLDKDSFLISKQYQADYIRAGTGEVRIGPVDTDAFIRDSLLHINKVWVNAAYFYNHKDKSLPFNAGIIKPLPVNMIKKIPFQLAIDSIELSNALVEYTEVNVRKDSFGEKKLAGTIPVTRMTVHLFNLKNYNLADNDSLSIRAVGYLMDSVWTRLRLKQSYTDSLGGFLVTLRMKPGDLTVLNSALAPLASIKLISGKVDTLEMRAIGREYLSLGEMKMFYKDLKIQLLKNGQENKRSFMTKMTSFLANTFVIRTNNSSHTGNVFFIRRRDRSAINYLVKIVLSGMASSVGVKSNKKMMRQYRNELEKKGLPPIDLE